jgi:hypothetical protein
MVLSIITKVYKYDVHTNIHATSHVVLVFVLHNYIHM